MISVQIYCDVDVDDVSVFERTIVWYTMRDNVVYASTARFWESLITQWRWIGPAGDDIFMNRGVDGIGGHSDFYERTGKLPNFARQCPGASSARLFLAAKCDDAVTNRCNVVATTDIRRYGN